jgi:hypothetical protein
MLLIKHHFVHLHIATRSSGSSGEPSLESVINQITLVPRCHSRISSSRLSSLHQRLFTLSTLASRLPHHQPFLARCVFLRPLARRSSVGGGKPTDVFKLYSSMGILSAVDFVRRARSCGHAVPQYCTDRHEVRGNFSLGQSILKSANLAGAWSAQPVGTRQAPARRAPLTGMPPRVPRARRRGAPGAGGRFLTARRGDGPTLVVGWPRRRMEQAGCRRARWRGPRAEGGWGNKWWVRWRGASASSKVPLRR